jgi:hypothetical protein
MKFFWAIIAIFIVGAAAAVFWPAKPLVHSIASEGVNQIPESDKVDSVAAPTTPRAAAPSGEPVKPAPQPVAPPVDPLEELKKSAATPVKDTAPSSLPPAAADAAETSKGGGEVFIIPDDPAFPADKIVPSKAEKRADGSILLDGRFVIRGDGTKEKPYLITWDQLVSAEEVYKPRLGQKRMPQRVTMLHNKHVRLTGFVAFPITSNNPKELLVMLNQWDGCCIGVPPTAYDAVEVRLAKAASNDERLAYHGMLEGVFKVDPYEDGGWLIGLYMMEAATLKPDN